MALELLAHGTDDGLSVPEPRDTFAHNLRAYRKKAQLSQEALGHTCGLHPTEISRLERAVRDPRLDTIAKLARALAIPPAKLLDGMP